MAKSKQQQRKEIMNMLLKIVRGWVGLETSNTRLDPKQEEYEVRNLIRQYDQLTKELDAENELTRFVGEPQ